MTEIERAIANAVGRVVVRRRLMRRVLQEVASAPSWDRRLPLSAPLVTPTSGPWPHRAADAAGDVAPCSKLGTRPLGDRVFHFLDPWEPRQALLLELFCLWVRLAARRSKIPRSGAIARHRAQKDPLTNNLNAFSAARPLHILRLGRPDKAKRFV